MVTEALWRHVVPGDRLAVCGPRAMIVEVARVCAAIPGVTAWFSLEAGMACGVGSCHGCVVPLADGTVARVCREGPVFTSATLFEAGRFSVGERSDGQ
jgi:dihydroorotate dehydrogenase electron transfer subunit